MYQLGSLLRRIRARLKMNQHEFADHVGRLQSEISMFENGRRFPDEAFLLHLAKKLELDPAPLIEALGQDIRREKALRRRREIEHEKRFLDDKLDGLVREESEPYAPPPRNIRLRRDPTNDPLYIECLGLVLEYVKKFPEMPPADRIAVAVSALYRIEETRKRVYSQNVEGGYRGPHLDPDLLDAIFSA